jgi:uncharacterized LabA/DUF88 family protein
MCAERVMVFIDGQNLVKALQRTYRARVHPVLLGRHLAGDTREVAEVRYYSGIHQPRENPDIHALASRRHKLIRSTGVTVIERTLQYHWEWGIEDRLPPPYSADDGEEHTVQVRKARRAREKGIDLALGLDAVTAALLDHCNTIVVVSRDRDLVEIANEINERARTTNVRVEVALVADRGRHVLDGYDYTHWIDEDVVDACRDNFDYRKKLPRDQVRTFLDRL